MWDTFYTRLCTLTRSPARSGGPTRSGPASILCLHTPVGLQSSYVHHHEKYIHVHLHMCEHFLSGLTLFINYPLILNYTVVYGYTLLSIEIYTCIYLIYHLINYQSSMYKNFGSFSIDKHISSLFFCNAILHVSIRVKLIKWNCALLQKNWVQWIWW